MEDSQTCLYLLGGVRSVSISSDPFELFKSAVDSSGVDAYTGRMK